MSKSSTTKGVTRKAHPTRQNTATKVTAKKGRAGRRKTKVTSASASNPYRITAAHTQVPNSLRSLAEMNVAQTRELYERSKNALQAVFESWEKSFGAASQGTFAFNRRLLDIAERNVSRGFDLATNLVEAKNLSDAMQVQANYWRKHFDELSSQAEEVRLLSRKVAAKVTEPLKAQPKTN
jgi:hypothetical protein